MLTDDENNEHVPRALLTDGERSAVRDDTEMSASTRSSHLSRVRGKMGKLAEDADILRQHQPELYEQMREIVLEEELTERVSRLERELDELRDQVES